MTIILLSVAIGGSGLLFLLFKKIKEEEGGKGVDRERRVINTTQSKLPFELIRDGVVKLKSGNYIQVLEAKSINTQLMEESEKEVVKDIWGDILNSIDYEIQFYKQSRIVDIDDYLNLLKEKFSMETSEKKRRALDVYYRFLLSLVRENSLQTKSDYVVVTYSPKEEKKTFRIEEVDEAKEYRRNAENERSNELDEKESRRIEFERARKILNQRSTSLRRTLGRLDIFSRTLSDDELLRLYYSAYNKERMNIQPLDQVTPREYTSLYVKGED